MPLALHAQTSTMPLDSNAFAAVLTCDAGSDFYTTFGHTAIRICDTAHQIDVVYNYGTFDFNTKHFYWKFACGNLNYCLSRTSFANFLREYDYEGRAVWQQRLRLTPQEVNNLFLMLEMNYEPQYRYYRYDFFKDNCATRVRDMISACLVHRDGFVEHEVADAMTYRQLLRSYTDNSVSGKWWQTGIDVLIGARCDRPCNSMEYMFLPMDLMRQLDTTHFAVADSAVTLADRYTTLLAGSETMEESSLIQFSPLLFFVIFLVVVIIISFAASMYGWRLTWLDATMFGILGILSLFIIFFWAFSAYACTKWNFNILWASPLFLYMAFRPNSSPLWMYITQFVLLVVSLIGAFWIQSLPVAAYLLIPAVGLRLFSKIINYSKS